MDSQTIVAHLRLLGTMSVAWHRLAETEAFTLIIILHSSICASLLSKCWGSNKLQHPNIETDHC